ncbi:MAG: hypothetical protein RML94_05410 [Bacteroidia bacterium]|nr:hypothetical protein [Bacteroidia bacterium]
MPRGWGAAPSARSTPTLWAYAQRNAHKDTPKKLAQDRIESQEKFAGRIEIYINFYLQ